MSLFGLGEPKPLRLVPFSEERPRLFSELLCDGFVVQNADRLADLVAKMRQIEAEHPGYRALVTLDNLNQACYTSGHGTMMHELDDCDGHDLSGLDPAAFEAGEHLGYLSTPSEFPIRLANLLARAEGMAFADACDLLFWDGDPASDPVSINRQPDKTLNLKDERLVVLQLVPVSRSADLIAALPNGYFMSDLNPMQNHALALHMSEQYGLELFGIGSRFLGFWAGAALEEARAEQLAADLLRLYSEAPADAGEQLAAVLAGRNCVLLRYTES